MRYNHTTVTRRVPSDYKIASLLGLSQDEFASLNCSELRPLTDGRGELIQYYIHISPFNPEVILAKLKMNNRRMIYFPPDAFESTI